MYVSVAHDTVYPRFTKSFNLLLKFAHVSASPVSGIFSICMVLGFKGNVSPSNLQWPYFLTVPNHLEDENDFYVETCFS